MARICVDGKWYEQVEPTTFSEQEFEDRVTLHAPTIYPFYSVMPFKKRLKAPDDTAEQKFVYVQADLVFIAQDYSEWWVVEVEMGDHDFKSHVKPQIEKLKNAEYDEETAQYLLQKYQNSNLDSDKLTTLIKEKPPQILLIANQEVSSWIKQWPKDYVFSAVFEVFHATDSGDEIFRVDGEYPSTLISKKSACSFHPIIPRLLRIDEPERMEIPKDSILKILYNNCLTEWRRIDESGSIYLTAINRNPLDSKYEYSIYTRNDGHLVLLQSKGQAETL